MTGFVDIHSHFVYGMDDGAGTQEEMRKMLDAAHAEGISEIFATPHVQPGIIPFEEKRFQNRLAEAQMYCDDMGYRIKLHSGAEVLYTPFLEHYIFQKQIPTLASSSYVLIEFTPHISFREMETAIDYLARGGYIPILAHMERYLCLRYNRRAWRLKKKHNICYQVNASSIIHSNILFKFCIDNWIRKDLIDYVASDAHDVDSRPFGMHSAYDILKKRHGENRIQRMFSNEKAPNHV